MAHKNIIYIYESLIFIPIFMPNLFTPPGRPSALIEKDGNVRHYSGTLRTFGSLQELQGFHTQRTRQSDAPIVFMNPFHTIRER